MSDSISIKGRQSRVKLVQILDRAGYDREKCLKAIDFPLIKTADVNGDFQQFVFDGVVYNNTGAGVPLNEVKKRDIKSVKMQRFRKTSAEVVFSGENIPVFTKFEEEKPAEKETISKEKFMLMDFYTRGDLEQIAFDNVFDQDVYYSNRGVGNWDSEPIFQMVERPDDLIQVKYPTFTAFPYRIKIWYTLGLWIELFHGSGDPWQITDDTAYIDGELTFVDFETFEPVLTISFHLYKSGWWESDKTYDTVVLVYDDAGKKYQIQSKNTFPGGGISGTNDSWVSSVFHKPDFFDEPEKDEESEEIVMKEIDLVYPKGWTYPFSKG